MLPGHPCSGTAANGGMSPTAQTPESAQYSTISDGHDSISGSPRSRSYSTHSNNFEIIQKMNSILSNTLNLTSLIEENNSTDLSVQGGFGDGETNTPPSQNRAVGTMRAIRGSGGNPIKTAEPIDCTPIKQPPQLSDHLKAILARQSHGGDFGSLISPLPMSNAAATNALAVGAAAAYGWHPFQVYPNAADMSGYFNNLSRLDYRGLAPETMTWAPLPIAPPSSSSVGRTPATTIRSSPERSASTGSSSSGISMGHLNDLMAQLNTNDSSPWSASPYQQQSQQSRNDNNRSEWPNIYQLRQASRPIAPLPLPSLVNSPPPPPPIATSATNSPPNQNDYTALLLAAANYINNSQNASGGGSINLNANAGANNGSGNKANLLQNDPSFGPPAVAPDQNLTDQQQSIERAARLYRKAATVCDATCTWSGQLPANTLVRTVQNRSYSCKVFVGGVPWDITEAALLAAFSPFGPVRVEWPGKEARFAKSPVKPSAKGKGYVYMIYESDRAVKTLLENCARDFTHAGEYYFQLTSRRLRTKEIRQVQIIPWDISDSNYLRFPSQRLDPKKTVFVGALHGMITAEVLCNVINDLFGGVVYAGIDTDKYKYPIGSGRVTFNNSRSYQKAIAAAFVEIKSAKFSKKVQIDPYLEDATCSNCLSAPAPYFCREFMCFRYFCKTCWHNQHALDVMQSHKPLMRNTRRNQQPQCVAPGFSNFPTDDGQQF